MDPIFLQNTLLCNKTNLLSIHGKLLELIRENETNHIIVQPIEAPPPPSDISVAVELIRENQVTISSMIKSVDQVLYGKFLLCRTIIPPMKFTALVTVVDDPEGELAARIALHNYVPSVAPPTTLAQYNEILPVGTILAIKNPLLKQSMDGGLALHVDNPTAVILMDELALQKLNPDLKWLCEIPPNYAMKKPNKPTDAVKKSWEEWKQIGNGHFAAEEYAKAMEAYTSGLQAEPDNTCLLGNRALVLLRLGKFDLALSDAEKILKINPTNMKGIARKARALWGLKEFQAAKDFLTKEILPELQADKDLRQLRDKAEMFFQQATFGNYPQEIHCVLDKVKEASFDWADYEGGVIVKDTADGRDRGLFATKDMAAGQLILASKAFVFVSDLTKSYAGASKSVVKLPGPVKNAELVSKLARTLKDNPAKGNVLYKLYAGPEMKYLDSEKGDDCSVVDIKRIEAICVCNGIGVYCQLTEKHEGSGMWILPSFINHSCIDCNAFKIVHGDFVFVRAFKDIKAGEEITCPYLKPTISPTIRKLYFEKYGFQCTCQLCEYERQESPAAAYEQEAILNKIKAEPIELDLLDDGQPWFSNKSMKKILPLFEQFMKIRPKYQFELLEIIEKLPFYNNKDYKNNLKYLKIRYEILKDTPLRSELLDTLTGIILTSVEAGKIKEAQAWAPVMRAAAISAHGSWDAFYNTGKDMIKFWQMCGVNI